MKNRFFYFTRLIIPLSIVVSILFSHIIYGQVPIIDHNLKTTGERFYGFPYAASPNLFYQSGTGYTWSCIETIYLRSELINDMEISNIAFQCDNFSSNTPLDNVSIYMKTTSNA